MPVSTSVSVTAAPGDAEIAGIDHADDKVTGDALGARRRHGRDYRQRNPGEQASAAGESRRCASPPVLIGIARLLLVQR